MSWIFLVLAGLCEIGFATLLKLSANFSKLWPTIGFFILAIASFSLLSRSLATIPIGTAYAIWTGIGAFGTAIMGMVFFDEAGSLLRVFFLCTLIASIIGLKIT